MVSIEKQQQAGLRGNQRGSTLAEYVLIAALVSLAALTAVGFMGRSQSETFVTVADSMQGGGTIGTTGTALCAQGNVCTSAMQGKGKGNPNVSTAGNGNAASGTNGQTSSGSFGAGGTSQ